MRFHCGQGKKTGPAGQPKPKKKLHEGMKCGWCQKEGTVWMCLVCVCWRWRMEKGQRKDDDRPVEGTSISWLWGPFLTSPFTPGSLHLYFLSIERSIASEQQSFPLVCCLPYTTLRDKKRSSLSASPLRTKYDVPASLIQESKPSEDFLRHIFQYRPLSYGHFWLFHPSAFLLFLRNPWFFLQPRYNLGLLIYLSVYLYLFIYIYIYIYTFIYIYVYIILQNLYCLLQAPTPNRQPPFLRPPDRHNSTLPTAFTGPSLFVT
ncbi:hypothetical protein BGZ63DRAFT_275680 [Mariannaea sp. PMI_226]|nr:hypothetical protein BGZ63DRAFT_275680 [Mariannaea sp. PMI_226]